MTLLTACSLQPITNDIQPINNAMQVEVTTAKFVDLPLPKQLQQDVNVSQLITVQWGEESKQKLLVQLQVDEHRVVLAGFSAWGVKLLSLSYLSDETGSKIETNVMAGLNETLPKPEQVLFNVMLAVWPEKAWQLPLAKIGWKLKETELQRLLIDENGEVVVVINYQTKPYLDGRITFKHHRLNYTVAIETKK